MTYLAVVKAVYDYSATNEEELDIAEDDVLYVLENDDPEWWKAQKKMPNPEETGPIGLVPKTYVDEARHATAQFDYEAAQDEELHLSEGAELDIYEMDDPDWYLCGCNGVIGLAPSNYIEIESQGAEHEAEADGAAGEEEFHDASSNLHPESVSPGPQTPSEPYVDPLKAYAARAHSFSESTPKTAKPAPAFKLPADEIKSWPVQELDKKKKKKGKGNLGIGNHMIFFGSETDKTSPVKQWDILDVQEFTQDGKMVNLAMGGAKAATFQFSLGSKSDAKALIQKIRDSQASASAQKPSEEEAAAPATPSYNRGSFAAAIPTPPGPPSQPETPFEDYPEPVHEQPVQEEVVAEPPCEPRWGVTLYPFQAEGEDELSVGELDQVLIIDYVTSDDWWKVSYEDGSGREGVVPASYLKFQEDYDADVVAEEEQRQREEEERLRQEQEYQEQMRLEEEAAERRRQEEQDAWMAQKLQEEEVQKRKQRQEQDRRKEAERRRKMQEARRQEEEMARKRAAAQKQAEAPPLPPQPSAQAASNMTRAARPQAQSAGGQATSKPDSSKLRTWTDRTGSFKVQAQFLDYANGKIRLHKLNGVKIDVPVDKMCAEDIQFIEEHIGEKIVEDNDNTPLGRIQPPKQAPAMNGSALKSSPKAPANQNKSVNPDWDWFEWFLAAGIPMTNAMHYADAFKGEQLDDSDINDLSIRKMRELGVKDKHLVPLQTYIATGQPIASEEGAKEAPENSRKRNVSFGDTSIIGESSSKDARQQQIDDDERFARELQAMESNKTPIFSKNSPNIQRRNSRPTPANAAPKDVNASAIAQAKDSINVKPLTPTKAPIITTPPAKDTGNLGFDDDAWTPRASPATTAPKPATTVSQSTPKISQPPVNAQAPPPPPPPAPPAIAPSLLNSSVTAARQRPVSPLKQQQQQLQQQQQNLNPTGQWNSLATGSASNFSPMSQNFQQHSLPAISPMMTGSFQSNPQGNQSFNQFSSPQLQGSLGTMQTGVQQPLQTGIQSSVTGLSGQPSMLGQLSGGFGNQPMPAMQNNFTGLQPPQGFQQPQMTGFRPQMTGFQALQPQMTAQNVPLSSVLPPSLIPTSSTSGQFVPTQAKLMNGPNNFDGMGGMPNNMSSVNALNTGYNQQRPNNMQNPMPTGMNNASPGITPQATGARSWANATPQDPFGNRTNSISGQQAGDRYAAFKNVNPSSPSVFNGAQRVQPQQTGFAQFQPQQPQMTGFNPNGQFNNNFGQQQQGNFRQW